MSKIPKLEQKPEQEPLTPEQQARINLSLARMLPEATELDGYEPDTEGPVQEFDDIDDRTKIVMRHPERGYAKASFWLAYEKTRRVSVTSADGAPTKEQCDD